MTYPTVLLSWGGSGESVISSNRVAIDGDMVRLPQFLASRLGAGMYRLSRIHVGDCSRVT